MKSFRGAGWGAALRKTLGRKGGTVGRRNERRDEPMRKRWRLQVDREVFGRGRHRDHDYVVDRRCVSPIRTHFR